MTERALTHGLAAAIGGLLHNQFLAIETEHERRLAAAVTAARADERERCVAALVDAAPSIGFGMSHDGHEDPQASSYVEGWHDAWAALARPADTEAGDA